MSANVQTLIHLPSVALLCLNSQMHTPMFRTENNFVLPPFSEMYVPFQSNHSAFNAVQQRPTPVSNVVDLTLPPVDTIEIPDNDFKFQQLLSDLGEEFPIAPLSANDLSYEILRKFQCDCLSGQCLSYLRAEELHKARLKYYYNLSKREQNNKLVD